MTTIAEYQKALDQAQNVISQKETIIVQQELENKLLREKLRLLQYRQFGKSSEKLPTDLQEALFALEEVGFSEDKVETIQVQAHEKKKPGRRPISAELPREEKVLDLPEEEKKCSTHQIELKKIGEDRSEAIEFIPQSVKVIVTVRPKYLCPCCEETKIKSAAAPLKLIPKSISTPSLLSHIAISKFVDHLPLYRQEAIFERTGIELSRTTMASWMIRFGEALIPIMNLLQEKLIEGEYISCDETPLRVLTDEGKQVKSLHYLWVRGRPPDFGKPIYLFEYASSRRAKVAQEILEGFKGYLQVDQYIGYDFTEKISEITRVGCFAHVRRKFHEAQKVSKEKSSISGRALSLISKLYQIEKTLPRLAPELRTNERKTKSTPILIELKTFLEQNQRKVSAQSATGKAISYALNSWPNLLPIFEDHRVKLDNNLIENALRPVALGRKNYLFCHTPEGAQAAARIYSLIATARANGLDLWSYFNRLIEALPYAQHIEHYEKLLPLA